MKLLIRRWLIILALLGLHCFLLVHFGVPPVMLAKFLLVVFWATFMPGWLLLSYLRLHEDDSCKLVLAPILGAGLNIIFFMLFSVPGRAGIYGLAVLLLILLLGQWQRLGRDLSRLATLPAQPGPLHFMSLVSLSLLFLGLLVIFQYIPNPLPGGGQPLIYYIDQPWHLGNIAEIKHHWYPQDPRLAGYPLHYHIFVYILMAFLAGVSGIAVPVLYLRLGTWFLLLLLFFTVYYSGCRWFHRRAAGLLHLVVFFFLGTLMLSYPYNLFLVNLFTSPTFLLASIFTLALILELRTYMEQGPPTRLLVIALLVTGLSGAKGNFFPLLFCGLLAYWFCSRQAPRPDSRIKVLLLTSSLCFLAVFFYIFRGGGSQGMTILPFEVVQYTQLYAVFSRWLGGGQAAWLKWALAPFYLLALLGFRLPVLIRLFRDLAAALPRPGFSPVFMASVVSASLAAGFLLSYRGRSQYFFLFAALILINLISAGFLLDFFTHRRARWLKLSLALLLLGSAVDTGLTIRHLPQVMPELAATSHQPLTPALYEALAFLRDNTAADALVAGYRAFIYTPDDPRFFYYSAFSERRILAEGWGYLSAPRQADARARYDDLGILYSTRDQALARSILDKYSIDFLIVENRLNQHLWFDIDSCLLLRFTNGETEIYQTIR